MVLAILAALGSAFLVAAASVLQHRAGRSPGGGSLRRVLRHPLWLLGGVAGVAGFGLHVVALSSGSLSLVQPLLVTGLLFALPMSWLVDRRGADVTDLVASAVVVAGLILFQTSAAAAAGRSTADLPVLAWCVVILLVTCSVAVVAAVRRSKYRASWLAFCAGAGYGLLAALLKSSTGTFAAHGFGVLGTWPLYAFLVLVGGAIAVNQLAFNAGPLSSSLPLVTIVDPVVSVVIGAFAFGETTASSPGAVAGQVAGFVLMSVGVVVMSRRASLAEASGVQEPPRSLSGHSLTLETE